MYPSDNCRKENHSRSIQVTRGKDVCMAALSFVFPVIRCDVQAGEGSP